MTFQHFWSQNFERFNLILIFFFSFVKKQGGANAFYDESKTKGVEFQKCFSRLRNKLKKTSVIQIWKYRFKKCFGIFYLVRCVFCCLTHNMVNSMSLINFEWSNKFCNKFPKKVLMHAMLMCAVNFKFNVKFPSVLTKSYEIWSGIIRNIKSIYCIM